MNGYIALVLLCILPFLLVAFKRVNVIFVYVSIVAGNLLVGALGDDAALIASGMFSGWRYAATFVQLVMLLLPVALSVVFSKGTVHGKMFVLQILPKFVCALMLFTFAVPLLPSDVQYSIFTLPFGDVLRRSQDIIVGLATILVLMVMWRGYRSPQHASKKHH